MRLRRPISACALAALMCGCGTSSPLARSASTAGTSPAPERTPGSAALDHAAALSIAAPTAVARAGGSQLAEFYRGRAVATRAGCLACHRIGGQGSPAPGPDLTHIGSMLPARVIERVLIRPEAPMPSFARLPRASFTALVQFLSALRCPGPSRGLMPRGC